MIANLGRINGRLMSGINGIKRGVFKSVQSARWIARAYTPGTG